MRLLHASSDHLQKFMKLVLLYFFGADPTCFKEALAKKEWRNAMEEELAVIKKNKTQDLVELPEGKNVTNLKWVFNMKYNADGSVQKYKARLVAKRYSQH